MIDLEMVLFENASATAVTSNVIDFGQAISTTPLFACFTGELSGTGNVTINIQECDTADGTFATVATLVAPAETVNEMAVIGLPIGHAQFVKATVSVASGITGTMTGYINDTYTFGPKVAPEGVEFIPTID